MYAELTETIFDETVKEAVFYAACVTMYRFNLLVSNSTVPQNMKRFKWHMLPLIRVLLGDGKSSPLNSKKAETEALHIVSVMGKHSQEATELFARVVAICQSLGDVSTDRLKRQAILGEMLGAI